MKPTDPLEACRKRLMSEIADGSILMDDPVITRPLLPSEAIGEGGNIRHDYPLCQGKEFLLEASFCGFKGQAFTERPIRWEGSVGDLLCLDLERIEERAVFLASFNAIARSLGMVSNTIHCRNDSLNICAGKIGQLLLDRMKPEEKVLIVGYQPAFIEAASIKLGAERVRVVDLDPCNIGRTVFGVVIYHGVEDLNRILGEVSFALVTGSSMANGTFERLHEKLQHSRVPFVLFGTSAAAPAALLSLERWCLESC